jgi:hypothetical protein
MKSNIEYLTGILNQSLKDGLMTRSEKKSLRDALSEVELNSREKIKLMSEVKRLAHQQSGICSVKCVISV